MHPETTLIMQVSLDAGLKIAQALSLKAAHALYLTKCGLAQMKSRSTLLYLHF
jgi:hypothetical protein